MSMERWWSIVCPWQRIRSSPKKPSCWSKQHGHKFYIEFSRGARTIVWLWNGTFKKSNAATCVTPRQEIQLSTCDFHPIPRLHSCSPLLSLFVRCGFWGVPAYPAAVGAILFLMFVAGQNMCHYYLCSASRFDGQLHRTFAAPCMVILNQSNSLDLERQASLPTAIAATRTCVEHKFKSSCSVLS